jgi:endonuclease/exonuclease/phosphatase family metal-dependent hydrolase
MTCNIRTSLANDGDNDWENRKSLCADVIRSRSPHIICFQEMTAEQAQFFSEELNDFSWVGALDEPSGGGPVNSIFFSREVFALTSSGSYWLSKTPHICGSKSWNSAGVRLATWARLRLKAVHCDFKVINTHLDHVSQKARVRQAKMIASDARAYAPDFPQVLTGDLNCDFTNKAIRVLRGAGFEDTYERAHGTLDPGTTFHRFRGNAFEARIGKMDWIMTRGGLKTLGAEIVRDHEGGRYPSDHYFVTADLHLSPPPD